MKNGYKKMLIVLFLVAIVVLLAYYGGLGEYLSLVQLQKQSQAFKNAVAQSYLKAVLLYCFSYILLVMATLPVVGPLTMLGGYLFGVGQGFVYALISATVGSFFSFLLIRYLLGSLLRERYKANLVTFQQKMKLHGYSYLLMLQLLTVVPFVVINTLAALTDVSLCMVFITTVIGSIPIVFLYALAGQQLGSISSVNDVLSPHMLLIMLILALLALMPIFWRKFRKEPELPA